ncbi:LacI family DNA-binding transcriptional regulator [Micromonospora sp. DT81.3]|uniref:LacI family DNA-binding transcriptional regulator n=1 Tax=Actinomycetes TaxID=1760 RepID=UPI003CFB7B16
MKTEAVHAAATIEDVAVAAGVSRSTVSRVVNGSTAVSPSAAAAVKAAIRELGFVPNRAARSLAGRQTYTIALVVAEDTTRFFSDPYFASIVAGVSSRLEESDYIFTLFIASDDPGAKMTGYLLGGNVDGAIVVSHHTSDTFIDSIATAMPVVYGGRPLREHAGDYYVDIDNVQGARDATEYLIGKGHRRIATITGPLDMPPGIDRLRGWREALRAVGVAEGPVEDGDFTAEGGLAAMRRILATGRVPDAIFVASDLMARGAMSALAVEGLRVPDDVAIIGFDDSPVATTVAPRLTTMRQPTLSQGARMTDVLLSLLGGGDPPRVTMMGAELVVRDSA